MEQQLYSCGKFLDFWFCRLYSAMLQWGNNFTVAERVIACGSMRICLKLQWGRGFSAAESQSRISNYLLRIVLQWGRGFSAAESRAALVLPHVTTYTSMGPRLFSRGKLLCDGMIVCNFTASMGPRLFSRGKIYRGANQGDGELSFNGAAAFQPRKATTPIEDDSDG